MSPRCASAWTSVVFSTGRRSPIGWAEEVIEPARAADHPRLAALYVMASLWWMPGRVEESVRYTEAGQLVIGRGPDRVPLGAEGWLGTAYIVTGQPNGGRSGAARYSHAVATRVPSRGHPWSSR